MNTTGFPSPAQGYEQKPFDFNEILIRHPAATYVMKYEGIALTEEGIRTNDILIVDSSIPPAAGRLTVIIDEADFRCVRLALNTSASIDSRFQYIDAAGNIHPVTQIFGTVTAAVRLV
jgi:DNA polymerase V